MNRYCHDDESDTGHLGGLRYLPQDNDADHRGRGG
jgi:hypothetical protein